MNTRNKIHTLEVNTENGLFKLDGVPLISATEISMKVVGGEPAEVTICLDANVKFKGGLFMPDNGVFSLEQYWNYLADKIQTEKDLMAELKG